MWTSAPRRQRDRTFCWIPPSSLSLSLSLSLSRGDVAAPVAPVAPVEPRSHSKGRKSASSCNRSPSANYRKTYRESFEHFRTFPRKAQRPVATEAKARGVGLREAEAAPAGGDPRGDAVSDLRHPPSWAGDVIQHTYLRSFLSKPRTPSTPHPGGRNREHWIGERDRERDKTKATLSCTDRARGMGGSGPRSGARERPSSRNGTRRRASHRLLSWSTATTT